MRKFICLVIVIGMLAIPASVFGSSYIGLGFFRGSTDYADRRVGMFDDMRPFGGVVRLGTYLKPLIAIEARYMDLWGQESASDGENGSKTAFDLKVVSGLVRADLPKTGPVQLYGLIGWASVKVETLRVSNKYSGVSYGGGMEVDTVENISLSVEYNHVVNAELCDVSGFTVLFNRRF